MNYYDYFIPLLVIIIVIAILLYFKYKNVSQEHFLSTIDLSEYGTRIYGDLFIGFPSRDDSDIAKDLIKEYVNENPQKFKDLNLRKRNIYINGNTNNFYVPKILLGSSKENSLTYENLSKFNVSNVDVPEFKLGSLTGVGQESETNENEEFVYYNGDTTETNQNKLCIKQAGTNNVKCIEPRHLDMINGKMLIKFKIYDSGSNDGEDIKSYNLEYAQQPSFENVAQRTFFMTSGEKGRVAGYLPDIPTCYKAPGKHKITGPYGKAGRYSGNFYLNPQDTMDGSYAHIHSHIHEDVHSK